MWGEVCGYTIQVTPAVSWLSLSKPSDYDLMLSVSSTDYSLADTITTISLTLIADYTDSEGPYPIIYTLDVTFDCKVMEYEFSSTILDQIYEIGSSRLLTNSFAIK